VLHHHYRHRQVGWELAEDGLQGRRAAGGSADSDEAYRATGWPSASSVARRFGRPFDPAQDRPTAQRRWRILL